MRWNRLSFCVIWALSRCFAFFESRLLSGVEALPLPLSLKVAFRMRACGEPESGSMFFLKDRI